MKKFIHFLSILFILIALSNSVAFAIDRGIIRGNLSLENRQALVIGNSQYLSTRLKNPTHDAIDMAEKLSSLNFKVTSLINANLQEMILAIKEFGTTLRQGGVGLFYYAGHGMQLDGKNYLVPVDAKLQNITDVEFEAVDTDRLLKNLFQAGNRLNLVILDACRDNPFFQNFRSLSNGLTHINAPSGTLVAFSTAPGRISADGVGRNGLFTKHLLTHMGTPGLEVGQMFRRVREAVISESDNRQIPWESSSLVGNFYFNAPDTNVVRVTANSSFKSRESQNAFLTVETIPAFSNVSILNISPLFYNGIELKPGDYQIEVQSKNYRTYRAWYTIGPGQQVVKIKLEKNDVMPQQIQAFKDCSDCPEMVVVPDLNIAIGKYEVTQAQWRALMKRKSWFSMSNDNPSEFGQCGDDCPVERISWDDIQTFIKRLNEKTGKTYRLPSEQEWYASCLAGEKTRFCGSNTVDNIAWHEDNANSRTHVVGKKMPNAWGLYDMTGNVWEWVADCFDPHCNNRILRGGSWNNNSLFVRSVDRSPNVTSYRKNDAGFRLALSLD